MNFFESDWLYSQIVVMKGIFRNLSFLFLFYALIPAGISGQAFDRIKVMELDSILNNQENKLYVINLWASWCAPCVSELPVFENTSVDYDTSKVTFVLVSLDFPSQIEYQLIPFLKKNNITLDVLVMMDLDYNSWINKIDSGWQGTIPATLLFNNTSKQRYFHSGEISESELRRQIDRLM